MAKNKIRINEALEFDVSEDQGRFLVNGKSFNPDIVLLDEGRYHVLFHGRSYRVELIKSDPGSKRGQLSVNGRIYRFSAIDPYDDLLEQLGMGRKAAHIINDLKAPMPGLVLKILVQPGDVIKKGDNLLVLEAMKMENIIKASGDAVIKEIPVAPGESVEKNQLLIRFEG